jgi:hypothetical protein
LATTQGYGVATGASSPTSITVDGVSYNLLAFTSDGTLTVTTPGLFDLLVVGGGGGGYSTWGGGAGAVVEITGYYLTAGSKSVTISPGAPANSGTSSSSVEKIVAPSGGYGDNAMAGTGASGGSGPFATSPYWRYIPGLGNPGHSSGTSGGGGGAGGASTNNTGGVGVTKTFTGTSVTYGTGGSSTGGASTANTGNGGNGGQAGASGVVYVRFRTA